MVFIVPACGVGAVVPQAETAAAYEKMFGGAAAHLVVSLGLDRLFSSFWFISLLTALGVNLAACSLIRIRAIHTRPGVLVTHVAVLAILAGSVIRLVWGVHGVLPMRVGETHRSFRVGDSHVKPFPFEIRLDNFWIDYRGVAMHILQVADRTTGQSESIAFTQPGAYRLNLIKADIRVLGVYPDFVMDTSGPGSRTDRPNNPAIHIEIARNGHVSRRWLFARFPNARFPGHDGGGEMACCADIQTAYGVQPGDIEQFRSRLSVLENGKVAVEKTIHVNEPLKYKGYVFYQSGYNPKDPSFSSLQVAKDPSVPMVYAGFMLLPIGLVWSFGYGNRKVPAPATPAGHP